MDGAASCLIAIDVDSCRAGDIAEAGVSGIQRHSEIHVGAKTIDFAITATLAQVGPEARNEATRESNSGADGSGTYRDPARVRHNRPNWLHRFGRCLTHLAS